MKPAVTITRLFEKSDPPPSGERFETLATCGDVVIQRIISAPKTASGPFLQASNEWVMVLQGGALLELDGEAVQLSEGDALMIPAHTPHRVVETSELPACIWLTVHIGGQQQVEPV